MADREFPASFDVQTDESGLNRLRQALKDNRTTADDRPDITEMIRVMRENKRRAADAARG